VPYILEEPTQIKVKFNFKYMPAIPRGKCDTFGVGYTRDPKPKPLPAVLLCCQLNKFLAQLWLP